MKSKVYKEIARHLNGIETAKAEYRLARIDAIEDLCDKYMPSGSGFDCGTKFDFDSSTPNKLVFMFDYHHLNENGYYIKWTSHKITVKPDMAFDIDVKITKCGVDSCDMDYYYDVVMDCLTTEIEYGECYGTSI